MASEVGMDVGAVQGIASKLDEQAGRIEGIVTAVDSIVGSVETDWLGHDAHDFVGWWRNQHRKELMASREAIAGLAQSARNNASDQEAASGANGGQPGSATANSFANDSVRPLGGVSGRLLWRFAQDIPVIGSILTFGAAVKDLGSMSYDMFRYGFASPEASREDQQGIVDSTNLLVGLVPYVGDAVGLDDAVGAGSDALFGTDTSNTFSPGYYLENYWESVQ